MPRFIVIADDAQLFVAADLTTAHAPVPKNSIVEGDFVTPGGVWLKVMVVATPDGPSQQPGFMREAAQLTNERRVVIERNPTAGHHL